MRRENFTGVTSNSEVTPVKFANDMDATTLHVTWSWSVLRIEPHSLNTSSIAALIILYPGGYFLVVL